MTHTDDKYCSRLTSIKLYLSMIAIVTSAFGCSQKAHREKLVIVPNEVRDPAHRLTSVNELRKALEDGSLRLGDKVSDFNLPACWCTSFTSNGSGEYFLNNTYLENDTLVTLYWHSSNDVVAKLFAACVTRVDQNTGDKKHGVTNLYGIDLALWSAYAEHGRR